MNSQLRFTEKRKFWEEWVKKMRNDFIERNKDKYQSDFCGKVIAEVEQYVDEAKV